MIQRIVVGLNGTHPAESLLPFTIALAQRLGADLTLAYAVNMGPKAARRLALGVDPNDDDEQATVRAYLSETANRFRQSGVIKGTRILYGEPATELVALAEQSGSDVIAVASHGRSGFHHLARRCVAETLLDITSLPVLLLPSSEREPTTREVRHVVVPLDGSAEAATVLPFATDLARNLGVPVVLFRSAERVLPAELITTQEEEIALRVAQRKGIEAYLEQVATGLRHHEEAEDAPVHEAEAYLARVAAEVRAANVEVDCMVAVGHPDAALEDYTWSHPESLVVILHRGQAAGTDRSGKGELHPAVEYLGAPALVIRRAG